MKGTLFYKKWKLINATKKFKIIKGKTIVDYFGKLFQKPFLSNSEPLKHFDWQNTTVNIIVIQASDRHDQHRGGDQDLGVDGRQRQQGLPEGDRREEEAGGRERQAGGRASFALEEDRGRARRSEQVSRAPGQDCSSEGSPGSPAHRQPGNKTGLTG